MTLSRSEHLRAPMNRVATLREQAAVLRKLAESFDVTTIKTELLALAERCDRLAEVAVAEIREPAKFSSSA